MFCLTPAATRVWVRCHQCWFKARCFFPSLTQRYSQVHYGNFFNDSFNSNNVNTQNRLSSENGMEQMKDPYGNVSDLS